MKPTYFKELGKRYADGRLNWLDLPEMNEPERIAFNEGYDAQKRTNKVCGIAFAFGVALYATAMLILMKGL